MVAESPGALERSKFVMTLFNFSPVGLLGVDAALSRRISEGIVLPTGDETSCRVYAVVRLQV